MEQKRSKYFIRNFISIFFGGVGAQAMYVLVTNYVTIFFTDFLGISAGVAGTIFLLSRIWDGINDPICGIWIEKSNPRFGKIPTFMAVGGVITAVSLILLFTIPNISLAGRTIWGTLNYNFVGMAFTAVTTATLLQMARGTERPTERVSLTMAYTVACSIAGILMATLITRFITKFGAENPARGYQVAAIISAVIGIIALLVSAGLFKDRAAETDIKSEEKEKTKVLDMIKGVIRVPSFLILVISICIANVGYGIAAANLMYYLTYVLKNPNLMTVLLPAMYIGLFGGSIIAPLFARFGKKRMMIVGMALFVIAALMFRIFEGNTVALAAGYGLLAGASSIVITYLQPSLVDCAEYTEYRTGIKCQALALTGFTFVSKMTQGLAAAVVGFALQIAKYDGMAAEQTEGAIQMMRNLMSWPLLLTSAVGIILLLLFYKLDEKTMEEARNAIHQRNMQ